MSAQIQSFGKTATSLSQSPLGIIALFIVLVYGFASLVIIFAKSFTADLLLPLIYFLLFFPILVLAVFAWLVSQHHDKLFGPSNFENQELFIEMMKLKTQKAVDTVSSVNAAQATRDKKPITGAALRDFVDLLWDAVSFRPEPATPWRNKILWVDDLPENNTYERQAFKAMGLRCTPVSTTDAAFEQLAHSRYAAIISDMDRDEDPRAGYKLLDGLRQEGDQTPLFFYTSSNAPEHTQETLEHGGQGSTNDPQELIEMVSRAVIEGRSG